MMVQGLFRTISLKLLVVTAIAAVCFAGCGANKNSRIAEEGGRQPYAADNSSDSESDTLLTPLGQIQDDDSDETAGAEAARNSEPTVSSNREDRQADQSVAAKRVPSGKKSSRTGTTPAEQDSNWFQQIFGTTNNEDSAAAVDDDIWRQFDLAEEYHSMGVTANREGGWEEAQYYFEKALKILANLDVETDTIPTPEAVKYSAIINNVVADYRVTLRSLGKLEDDAAPSVLLERFGDLEEGLESDSIQVFKQDIGPVVHDLPIVMNERVRSSIVYFQTVAKKAFARYLSRINLYRPLYSKVLAEYGLPQDLVYLSLVESGFNPNAYSWARAMGLWQFIASTGRMYGLERDWWIDERKDPTKSTDAAARFLRDLYNQFGDWELAMAAYNGGPRRVENTIRDQRTRDFWRMKLKRQTMDYVPLIYAAAIIAKEPQKYGFRDVAYEPSLKWEEVTIKKCLDLKTVAEAIGCGLEELKALNPELLRGCTPPGGREYVLKIPTGRKDVFMASYEDMASPRETQMVRHTIRQGESVKAIASRYGVSQYALLEANHLTKKSKIIAGRELIIPVPLDRSTRVAAKANADAGPYESSNGVYKVRSGDTMWDIAKAFNTSIDAIRRLNYLERGARIYVGQSLRIPGSSEKSKGKKTGKVIAPTYAQSGDGKSGDNDSGGGSTKGVIGKHTVRRGDNLWTIAQRYNTTVDAVRALNGLSRSAQIYPGQVLKVKM